MPDARGIFPGRLVLYCDGLARGTRNCARMPCGERGLRVEWKRKVGREIYDARIRSQTARGAWRDGGGRAAFGVRIQAGNAAGRADAARGRVRGMRLWRAVRHPLRLARLRLRRVQRRGAGHDVRQSGAEAAGRRVDHHRGAALRHRRAGGDFHAGRNSGAFLQIEKGRVRASAQTCETARGKIEGRGWRASAAQRAVDQSVSARGRPDLRRARHGHHGRKQRKAASEVRRRLRAREGKLHPERGRHCRRSAAHGHGRGVCSRPSAQRPSHAVVRAGLRGRSQGGRAAREGVRGDSRGVEGGEDTEKGF